jgi:hypothetical protein
MEAGSNRHEHGTASHDRPVCNLLNDRNSNKATGRKPKLTGQIRKRLIARATLDAAHRRMTYKEIAQLEGIQADRKALVAAFKKESYHRRVATAKPLLTPSQKQARLAWAREHLEWTPEMWACIIWTDECSSPQRALENRM